MLTKNEFLSVTLLKARVVYVISKSTMTIHIKYIKCNLFPYWLGFVCCIGNVKYHSVKRENNVPGSSLKITDDDLNDFSNISESYQIQPPIHIFTSVSMWHIQEAFPLALISGILRLVLFI